MEITGSYKEIGVAMQNITRITSFLLFISFSSYSQYKVHLINETDRPVWIQKASITGDGSFPVMLDSIKGSVQNISIESVYPAILFVGIVPVSGPYGSGDGVAYLFKANDTLLIKSNKSLQPVITHISSKERNRELNMALGILEFVNVTPYNSLRKAKSKVLKSIYSPDISIKNRDKILDSLSRSFINSIETYCKLYNINNEAGELYRSHFKGMLYYSKLNEYNARSYKYKDAVINYYQDSVARWSASMDCTECVNIPFFQLAANQIFNIRYRNLTPSEYLISVSKATRGSLRDFLLSRFVSTMIDRGYKGIDSLLMLYQKLCSDLVYRSYVINNYKLHSTNSDGKNLSYLLNTRQARIGYLDLISKYKGKIVYIDFWASWCAPCIQEMPYSKALKEQLKEMDVELLYISTDTDFNNWLKATRRLELNEACNYILINSQKDALTKTLNLNSIPRYVILDKSGKVIYKDASRPSEKETYTLLSNLANTKN